MRDRLMTLVRRIGLLLLVPLLFIDCFLAVWCDASFRLTLSGEAWRQRHNKYWGWTHRLINGIFCWQQNHCKTQAEREDRYGSCWKAWALDWKFA